jgi:hypothetical protein
MTRTTQPIYLWKCLLHSSPRILDDQRDTFARFTHLHPTISSALSTSTHYPWSALTSLQAPKFFSDVIEAVLGAVYLDSRGDLGKVEGVLEELGVMKVLRRVVEGDVDVRHPVSRLAIWVARTDRMRRERRESGEGEEGKAVPEAQSTNEASATSATSSPSPPDQQPPGVVYNYTKSSGIITCTILVDGQQVASASGIYRGRASRDEVRFRAAEEAIEVLEREYGRVGDNF